MAVIKAVQSGSVTLPADSSSQTVTITAVDTTKAFVVFGVSVNANSPGSGQITGQVTNATTLTFARSTAGGAPAAAIHWYVAEFESGVSVQRGSGTVPGAGTLDVALTNVDRGKAFPIISQLTAGGTHDANDFVRAKITSPTNLQLIVPGGSGGPIEWQVVEFDGTAVQSGDIAFASGDSSKTAAVVDVNTSRSWLLFTYDSATGTTSNIGQKMIRGQVTNPGTLTFDRDNTGQAVNLTWYLIEFSDGTIVHSGSENFTADQTQKNVTISSTNINHSIATAGGMYHRGGKTPYSTDDHPGVATVTLDLTDATNLQLTRPLTGSTTADIGWFVIDFSTEPESIPEPANLKKLIYIEQVKFTEPYALQIVGGDDHRLDVFMAQRGLKDTSSLIKEMRNNFHPKDRDIVTAGGSNVSDIADSIYPSGDEEGGLCPPGIVVFWPPDAGTIPMGWQIYLPGKGKFLVGYDDIDFFLNTDGGALTINIEHSHTAGTLAADSGGSHSHTAGTLEADSGGSHSHTAGTLGADAGGTHTHNADTIISDGPSGPQTTVQSGTGVSVASNVHVHDHTAESTGSTGSSHSHTVSGSTGSGGSHTHTTSGSTGSGGSHTHTVSGSTATTGSTTQSILPPFHVGTWIQFVGTGL